MTPEIDRDICEWIALEDSLTPSCGVGRWLDRDDAGAGFDTWMRMKIKSASGEKCDFCGRKVKIVRR